VSIGAHTLSLGQIGGLVLAGGRSRRFGAEKALAPFRGAPMMDAILDRFGELPIVAVSARRGSAAERRAAALGLPVLYDSPSAPEGPLAGICAALEWARGIGLSYVASAPCDAPLLPHDLLPQLARAIGDAPAAYATTERGPHPLCALWSVRLQPALAIALAAGEHPPVRALLQDVGAHAVRFDDDRAFLNANTPAALAAMEGAA
jgi:molybdopterin-guanine dinucleotide biosynthesis protein A